ncbi:t-SNARE [Entophlyctis helioformis]|nr:t-SNARE [Entophlyctis helioformis]
MAVGKDRTQEFMAAVESLRQRSGGAAMGGSSGYAQQQAAERRKLLSSGSGGGGAGSSSLGNNGVSGNNNNNNFGSQSAAGGRLQSKSEFTRAAAAIGREINSTMTRLQKLTLLAKRKSLFDDRPVEINELIYVIKQDIARVNLQIGKLSEYLAKSGDSGSSRLVSNRQTKEHSHNVITSLQSKLASTSDTFKHILELRFENMKEQKNRRDQYSFAAPHDSPASGSASGPGSGSGASPNSHAGAAGASNPFAATAALGGAARGSDSPLYHPERRSTPLSHMQGPNGTGSDAGSDHIIDFGGGSSAAAGLQAQQMFAPNESAQMEYIESRSQAIESIEQTIAELGQIYQNFATILAGQREMVQRIDDNVMDVQMNVEGAHTQLTKYYQNISSNRALMLKVFAAVIFFFLVFVMMT